MIVYLFFMNTQKEEYSWMYDFLCDGFYVLGYIYDCFIILYRRDGYFVI
jgi:hypothetical protein